MFRPFLIPSAHDQTRTRHAVALWTTVTSGSVSSLAFLGAGEVTIAFQGGRGGVCLFYKNKKQRIDYCISEKQGGGGVYACSTKIKDKDFFFKVCTFKKKCNGF